MRNRTLAAAIGVVTLFAATAGRSATKSPDSREAAIPAPTSAECALLDDPKIAARMDGLLEYLAEGCGREAEFIGGVRQDGGEEVPDFNPTAVDAPVSNPAQDVPVSTALTQSETSIAVNPNTGTLCAAWNDAFSGVSQGTGFSGFGRSTDNGLTWVDKGAVNPTANFDSGDPSLIWRQVDGKFYYVALKSGGLGIYRSDDDCNTFTFVAQVSSGSDDKEIAAVDNTGGPNNGRIYVAWTDFGSGAQIFSTFSTNAGASWSPQVALSAPGEDVQGAWPVVAPNGDVFVGWIHWMGAGFPNGNLEVQIARSTNGGVSYSLVTSPMVNQTNPRDAAAQSACGRPALKGNIRYLPNPTIAVDGSGTLHAVYSYDPDATGSGDVVNVYYRRSTDSGATWQTEVKINDNVEGAGTFTDQYQPSLSVGAGNVVAVGYYSRQNDTANNLLLDYYSRVSYDGGVTWQPSTRLSDVSSGIVLDPNLATCYHGDYDTNIHRVGAAQYLWSDDRPSPGTGHADPNIYSESTPAGIDYLLVPGDGNQQLCTTAGSAVYPVDLFQFQGFNESVTLSLSGEPAGATKVFSPNPATVPGSSSLTVGNLGPATPGIYEMTISGSSIPSAVVHTANIGLELFTGAPGPFTLISPVDGAIDQARSPLLDWSDTVGAVEYLVEVATDDQFNNIVRSHTGTASEWVVTPGLDITTQYFWRATAMNPCGEEVSSVFDFTTATPTVLLVDDDDDGPDVGGTYNTILNALVVFDTWNVTAEGSEPTAADLEPYKAVVWFSGDRFTGNTTPSAGPQSAGEAALSAYLGFGRCLLISSQDYLWDMGGPNHNVATSFMASNLGLASGTSDTGDYTRVDGLNIYGALVDQNLTYPFTD
ncbi:MAG: hypothetical protein AB7G12_14145, partial [Thermoanaerobaculia bacterium]